ncbi:MarR family winged helix-turn-helix transcriptional regulator [Agromyces mangrovi Wang et al. 2018]|uniref:MarR family winged helix-turn-helix transcriptional regulator n=1 Tax=Agromyces mangrovi TaxID=1858653 RepID=UPI0025737CC7|nr:MarR family winged helix-turn-helix transcriptional regulator [Agromyces mangrovi]BDZ65267.1 MarR family transcriptional regulator [Agromyces mangrovi]
MPLDPDDIDLPALVALTGAAVDAHVLARVRASGHPGARRSHGYVIQALISGEPAVGDLARDLGVTQQAVSKCVAELESLGYAERVADPGDARVRRIRLTDHGHDLVETTRAIRRSLERTALDDAHEQGSSDDEADASGTRRTLVALLAASGGLEAVRRRRAPVPES